jgi:CubicO group peptidase (beta-lactamase class C family)
VILLSWLIAAPALSRAANLPIVEPEEVGLSSQRLAGAAEWLKGEVAQNKIPGAVIMVVRAGKIAYFKAVGRRRPDSTAPMLGDDIFRVYSLTKPVTSVAALMLVEEGKLSLAAPVSRFIPSFVNVKVGVEKIDADGQKVLELVPPQRAMTVLDLMRHTSGLTYATGDGLVNKAYRENGVSVNEDATNAEFAERIARMPLAYQPGTTWEYSNSTDILGRIIEVVSGQTLFEFLKSRLFEPLGMPDTSFYVREPARQARIAEPMKDDVTIGIGSTMSDPRIVRKMEAGGSGLVSTAPDYAKFLMMLLNRGQLDGRRYLSPLTLDFMLANHLSDAVVRKTYLPGPGYGFGLGVAVRTSIGESTSAGALGEYYWPGASGADMWVDPASDLFVIFLMQSPKNRIEYRQILRNMIYGAVIEPHLKALP